MIILERCKSILKSTVFDSLESREMVIILDTPTTCNDSQCFVRSFFLLYKPFQNDQKPYYVKWT